MLKQSWNCPESVTNAIIQSVGLCYYLQTSSFYNNIVALEANLGPAQVCTDDDKMTSHFLLP